MYKGNLYLNVNEGEYKTMSEPCDQASFLMTIIWKGSKIFLKEREEKDWQTVAVAVPSFWVSQVFLFCGSVMA